MRISENVLANGLKVLCCERHNLPIVTLMTCYRVGGEDVFAGKTGIAHFLEHMMFKGTEKFPKGSIDRITQKLGGHNNAFTSMDFTCYFFSFASDRWEKALEIEADRMQNCKWSESEFASEKKVILEELRSCMDNPLEFLSQELQAVSYQYDPYRNPIIGWKQDLEDLELEDLEKYYRKYYAPNNAVIIVVGDVKNKKVLQEVKKFFGKIPASNPFERNKTTETFQTFQKRVEIKTFVEVPRFEILFHTCPIGTKEDYVLDLIDIILATGRSSRLYRRLVLQENIAQSIVTYNDTRRRAGTFHVIGELYSGIPQYKLEEIIDDELKRLQKSKVSKYELERAKNIYMADFVFQQETTYSLAEKIAQMELLCSFQEISKVLSYVEEINTKDIQNVARKYLNLSQSTIGFSLPQTDYHPAHIPKKKTLKPIRHPRLTNNNEYPHISTKKDEKRGKIHHYSLENGIHLLMMENHALPCISMEIHTRGGFLYEEPNKAGTAFLLGRLLSEGTTHRTSEQISSTVDFLGASLSTTSARISMKSFTKDFPTMCAITSDILRHPKFSKTSLASEKRKALASLISQKDSTSLQARNEFYKTIYGNHPFARSPQGSKESIAKITQADIVKFHKQFFVPNNVLIAIAGDIHPQETYDYIQRYFGDWKSRSIEFPELPEVKLKRKAIEKRINLSNKQQIAIYWGHLGIRRNTEDYYALLLLDNILGVGAGFTDRLSQKIRDEMGLVYTVWASITANAGIEPGTFTAYLATEPKNYSAAIDTLHKELHAVCKSDITQHEIDAAKAYLTGNFVFALESNSSLADYLLATHRYQLGFDYIDRFPKMIENITRDQVVEAARKYLQPEVATTVVAGPVKDIR